MTSGGVLAGAASPFHELAFKPGTPADCAVGTSGSTREAWAPVTASGRNALL